jgi:predicted DNA-binding transcriptional regulator AlpA
VQTYDFTFFVGGFDAEDDAQVDRFFSSGRCDDAMPASRNGVVTVSFAREAERPPDALRSAADDLEWSMPGARVLRLDPDLVNVPEIAARTEKSRQAVEKWVKGRTRYSCFPSPETDGGGTWRWSDVYRWMQVNGLEVDDDLVPIGRDDAVCFDFERPTFRALATEPPSRRSTRGDSPYRARRASRSRIAPKAYGRPVYQEVST